MTNTQPLRFQTAYDPFRLLLLVIKWCARWHIDEGFPTLCLATILFTAHATTLQTPHHERRSDGDDANGSALQYCGGFNTRTSFSPPPTELRLIVLMESREGAVLQGTQTSCNRWVQGQCCRPSSTRGGSLWLTCVTSSARCSSTIHRCSSCCPSRCCLAIRPGTCGPLRLTYCTGCAAPVASCAISSLAPCSVPVLALTCCCGAQSCWHVCWRVLVDAAGPVSATEW